MQHLIERLELTGFEPLEVSLNFGDGRILLYSKRYLGFSATRRLSLLLQEGCPYSYGGLRRISSPGQAVSTGGENSAQEVR